MTAAMPPPTTADSDLDILAVAALRLLGSGGGAAELAERFNRLRVPRTADDAAAMLDHLARLGLVRVANTLHGDPAYVLTLLGERYADTVAGSSHPVAAELEELEHLRTDFMSTIAHELRTPLTVVRTCVGLLLEYSVAPEPAIRTRLLENAARNADQMQRLVTDLLDLARMRTGHNRLQLRRFDASALARDTAAAIAPLAEAQRQTLEISVPDDPIWVYADRRRLEQAVLNLLSNAQKFSADGACMWLSLRADEEWVAWSVRDVGPGIDSEDQAHLFERFFTRTPDAVGRKAGTGLGLPIALAIAQSHGGTILVDSAVGHGSTFTLSVPRYADVEADEE
jgi:signal transduction histidine kinase